jgi:microcystin-dependent protein
MADGLTANYSFVLPEIGASDDTWGTKLNANWSSIDGILKTNFDTFKTNIGNAMPIGTVAMRAATAVPAGWLECNGSAISRTTYALLFAVIGANYGAGDGVNTFNLPDMRGEFARGFDGGRGVDSGRTLGVPQADGMRQHNHTASSGINSVGHTHPFSDTTSTTSSAGAHTHPMGGSTVTPTIGNGLAPSGSGYVTDGNVTGSSGAHTHTVSVSGTTGAQSANHTHAITVNNSTINATGVDETRPRNVAFMYMIKTGL